MLSDGRTRSRARRANDVNQTKRSAVPASNRTWQGDWSELMPPNAIVCVRRFQLSSLRSLEDWTGMSSGAAPMLALPFHEPVSADAAAIMFTDEAELLACLARDWRLGNGDRWWWRSLYPEAVSPWLVQHALIEAPHHVPRALELLAEAGVAVDVLLSLPPVFCERLGDAVAAIFDVPAWNDLPDRAPHISLPPEDSSAKQEVIERVRVTLEKTPLAEALVELPPSQRALIGIALLLQRAPALARTPGVIAALRSHGWTRRIKHHHDDPDAPPAGDAVVLEFKAPARCCGE